MSGQVNPELVISCVNEFYSTTDADRRQILDKELCQFKSSFPCDVTITTCIRLMDPTQPANVRYFGAISLYETVRQRSEECIANLTLIEGLKVFLIENLTTSAHTQMQSITNKLSSTLALLALYSIPDVWPCPVQDLTIQWANAPELLLRVLAELAAEFANIQMPLTQRSVLKTELHRIAEDIIRIIRTVLGAADATHSTRQAAVDCVEQWLQLPGVGLDQWTGVLHVVFAAVTTDSAALTNLFNILAVNDELSSLEQLVLDICQYITNVAAQNLAAELRADSESEEVVSLVAAVCSLAERAVPTLIRHAKNHQSTHLVDLCQLFVSLSSWDGRYPIDESISDLPAVFFTTLREELMATRTSSSNDKTAQVIASVSDMFASVCSGAIGKLAFPPANEWDQFDKQQKEQFVTYRRTRSEVPVDAFYIVGNDTLSFLNQQLEQLIGQGDVCRTECCLYLWELVADYLSEEQYPVICRCLELVSRLAVVPTGREGDRLGNTLMRLLYALSHLIQDHDRAVDLESHAISLIVVFLTRPRVVEEALRTLEKYVEERSESVARCGDDISERCYSLFMDTVGNPKVRLSALKCIGIVLSTKPTETVMTVINQLIAPHVSSLGSSVGGGGGVVASGDAASVTEQSIFQINIFASLFSTLDNKKNKAPPTEATPTLLILRQAIPVFSSLLETQGTATEIGNKVCEAVRSAVLRLPASSLGEVFSFIAQLIERSLATNAAASCSLAKSVVLICGGSNPTSQELCGAIARWFALFEKNGDHPDIEEWLALAYQIVKKDWKTLRLHGETSMPAISSAISLCGNTLVSSMDPCVVRLASQVLATIANQTTSFADEAPRQLLANNGPPLVKTIFLRVQSELMRNTVESLSELLFFFAKHYPAETRTVLSAEAHGDSPMVAAMFREVGNLRNFKQMTLRLNQEVRKAAL